MPRNYQMPIPPAFKTPLISDLPMNKYYQKQFETEGYRQMLKTYRGRQNSEYQDNHELWQAGKMKGDAFLASIDTLIEKAKTPNDVKKFEVAREVAQGEVFSQKFDREYDIISGDYVAGKITVKEAYNRMTQLSVQAATAGLENLSAKYYLSAETFLEGETKPKGSGVNKTQAKNNVMNAISDIFY